MKARIYIQYKPLFHWVSMFVNRHAPWCPAADTVGYGWLACKECLNRNTFFFMIKQMYFKMFVFKSLTFWMHVYVCRTKATEKVYRYFDCCILMFENRHAPWCLASGCGGHRRSGNVWLVRIVREETQRVLNGGVIQRLLRESRMI